MQGDEGLFAISVLFMFLSLLVTPFISTLLAWFTVNLPKRRAAAIIGSGVGSLLISIGLLLVYLFFCMSADFEWTEFYSHNTNDSDFNQGFTKRMTSLNVSFAIPVSITAYWATMAIIMGRYLLRCCKEMKDKYEIMRSSANTGIISASDSAISA